MNISKFEAIGIGASIVAMVLALFLMRMQSSLFAENDAVVRDTLQASVVVSDDTTQDAALADAIVEASGGAGQIERLIIDDVIEGTGEPVAVGDTVTVHYIGTLQNGQQFDNSYTKGEPFSFKVGDEKVIRGWEEGVIGMKAGGQRILVVPPALAYGSKGYGPIPSDATLVFAVELLTVEK